MSEELRKLFSCKLQECLQNSGLTMAELAKKIGVSQATISDWCNGKKAPRFDKIEQLAKFFNVSPTYFFNDEIVEYDYKQIKNPRLYEIEYKKQDEVPNHTEAYRKMISLFAGENFTPKETEEIKDYIEFIKSKREK
jgi:transcriptional regulator with XRE-family HTH domain